jgi:hypothetical protein
VFQEKNCPFKIGEKRQFEIHPKRRNKKEKREREDTDRMKDIKKMVKKRERKTGRKKDRWKTELYRRKSKEK